MKQFPQWFLIGWLAVWSAGCSDNSETDSESQSDTSGTNAQCTTCHGFPPSIGRHSLHVNLGYKCTTCHSAVIDASDFIVDDAAHDNGTVNVKMTAGTFDGGSCANTGCHGTKPW